MIEQVQVRAGGRCELCAGTEALLVIDVPPNTERTAERAIQACVICREGLDQPGDDPRWRCLSDAIWSEVPAVQVASFRILHRISASWARDLIDQVWMDEDQLAWAQSGVVDDDAPATVDSNGTPLRDGDNVTLIRDLDVKGANFTAKRGTLVKNIRVGDDPGLVEGRVNRTVIFLKTEFLKKA